MLGGTLQFQVHALLRQRRGLEDFSAGQVAEGILDLRLVENIRAIVAVVAVALRALTENLLSLGGTLQRKFSV